MFVNGSWTGYDYQAKQLDSSLDLDPEAEAQRLAEPTFENVLDAAVDLAGKGDDQAAKARFEEALELATGLYSAETWHSLCVAGGRWQQAELVLEACDQAIEMEPENGQYYNSRAFVRQQLGDMAGVRADFAEFEKWLDQGSGS